MNFVVYSKDGCPYCDKISQVLNYLKEKNGYSFVKYNLNKDFTREDFYKKFGYGTTFPQVLLNDVRLGGCSDAVQYLSENNLI